MSCSTDRTVFGFLAAALVGAGPALAGPDCPARVGGRPLAGMDLYTGDPARSVALAADTPPVRAGWANVWELRSSTGVVAVCRYAGGGQQAYALPPGIGTCRADGNVHGVVAGCR